MRPTRVTGIRRAGTRVALVVLTLVGGVGVAAPTVAAAAAACSDVDVVVARGTGEPGTLGAIVGDPVYSALRSRLTGRTLSSYAVNYPASVAPGSASIGNQDLVNHVNSQASACSAQRFILVGYSQGANRGDAPQLGPAPGRGDPVVRQPDPRDRPQRHGDVSEPHAGPVRDR
jgi:hypothetical protein